MKISEHEACEIAERIILQSYKGKLELSGARLAERASQYNTLNGQTNGEWIVVFRKVMKDGIVFEPHLIIIHVNAETGEAVGRHMI